MLKLKVWGFYIYQKEHGVGVFLQFFYSLKTQLITLLVSHLGPMMSGCGTPAPQTIIRMFQSGGIPFAVITKVYYLLAAYYLPGIV